VVVIATCNCRLRRLAGNSKVAPSNGTAANRRSSEPSPAVALVLEHPLLTTVALPTQCIRQRVEGIPRIRRARASSSDVPFAIRRNLSAMIALSYLIASSFGMPRWMSPTAIAKGRPPSLPIPIQLPGIVGLDK
jgi:hypothetical protein